MTNNKLALRQENSITPASMPPGLAIRGLDDVMKIGRILAASGFFKDAKSEAQAAAKILRGWELGIAPFAALETVYVIEGKTALAAHMIAALIKKSGRYNYRVKETSNTACTVLFFELGEGIGEYSYTIEDAKQANLINKSVWKSYPKAMLYSRCMSAGAKMFCPDVFGGAVYVPEELGAEVDAEGNVISVPVEVIPPASLPQSNGNAERIRAVTELLGVDTKMIYQVATNALGISKQSKQLTPEECGNVIDEILVQWGMKEGVFSHINHARNTFKKLLDDLNADESGCDEIGIAQAWKAEVESRVAADDDEWPDTSEATLDDTH